VVRALVEALLAGPPATIADLETALRLRFDERWAATNDFGTFTSPPFFERGDVVSFSAVYRWDMHHENPPTNLTEQRARSVLSFEVTFSHGGRDIDEALEARFGPPRAAKSARVYGTWIVKDLDGGRCSLAFAHTLPDWAMPEPDAALRERYLHHIAALATKDEIARAAEVAPNESGIVLAGTARAYVTVELMPPMGALDLVRAFEWKDAIAESSGVNQTSWSIALVTGTNAYGLLTSKPKLGAHPCTAALADRPKGGNAPGHLGGPTARRVLLAEDRVRYLEIAF